MHKSIIALGIESSCDDTSIGVIKVTRKDNILASEKLGLVTLSQEKLHKGYGGVVPEIAARGTTPFEDGPTAGQIELGGDGVSLSTGDNFVTAPPALASDIVDMEAYAIAKVCWLSGVDFMCFKYISDDADNEAPNNWEKNIWSGKEAFKAFISDPHFQEHIFAKERK